MARLAVVLAMMVGTTPAAAASLNAEASTDMRRRGLGWSDGRAAVELWGSVPITNGFSVEAGAATLRSSARHGGADLLGEAAVRLTRQSGAWTLWGEVQGVGFTGASHQNYAQLRAGGALGIGPVQVSVQTAFAPPQSAIGGSNLYVAGRASVGIPGTPVTLAAGMGHSTGSDDGSGRSQRLRPGGDYSDFRLDIDYVVSGITLGASATTTTIAKTGRRNAADGGTRVLFRAAISF